MELYHTGFDIIEAPDIHFGRQNADFGQGFYLSGNREFSVRWARERKGRHTYLNTYVLDTAGLSIKRFARDAEWFGYIYRNRNGYADALAHYDMLIGPIANDTIYDIWGITTSGLLSEAQALEILSVGPQYEQVVVKSEKAAAQLHFLSSAVLPHEEIAAQRAAVSREESAYQDLVGEKLGKIAEILE